MYRSGELRREFGLRGGPYAGGRLVVAANALSGRARRRLSAALLGDGFGSPILSEAPARSSRALQILGVLAGASGLFALGMQGFGVLGDSWAVQSEAAAWAYGAALLLVVESARGLSRSIRGEGLVPLPQGRFLLPYDLVAIEGETLTIRPLGNARHVRVDEVRSTARILYSDGSVSAVRGGSNAGAPSVWARVLAAQYEIEEASCRGTVLPGDPLAELRGAGGWLVASASPAARARRPPGRPFAAFAAVVAFCALIAPGALALRNRASDDAMFAAAKSAADYRAYLHAGGLRHRGAVCDWLLPRATLDEAERRGDVRSLRAFLAEFPASKVDAEARARFHEACVADLSRQPIESARSFDVRNPDCGLAAAARERVHAVYEARFEEASSRGLVSLRGYVQSVPDVPFFHDRAVARLAELYETERSKVSSGVQRAELREVLLRIARRAQRDEVPGSLYVPVIVVDPFDAPPVPGSEVTRGVLAGFDAAVHEVLDGALLAIYHPASSGPADLGRGDALRIVVWPLQDDPDGSALVRYELASGGRTMARWTRAVTQDPVPERFGAELARAAMTL